MEIQGNHKTDLMAKTSHSMVPNKNSKIPYTDQRPKINKIN